MELNWLGLVSALTAFISIWSGHVSVRKIEANVANIRLPMAVAILLGLGMEAITLFTDNVYLGSVLGILSITLLWDAFELFRQQKRVRRGHAPANPNNPRHARILAEPGSHATPLDLLDREPIGRRVNQAEAEQLIGEVKRR